MKYRKGVVHSGPFPGLVIALSSRQERWYKTRHSHEFCADLPSGVVDSTGLMINSTPIIVNGVATPFTLGGKYDFLIRYDHGTYGVIDTKIVGKGGKSEFYWPQLAAYEYILAHPTVGDPRKCETLGLMVWAVADANRNAAGEFTVGFSDQYEPVTIDTIGFEEFISKVVVAIMGDMPASGESCANCKYFDSRILVDNP